MPVRPGPGADRGIWGRVLFALGAMLAISFIIATDGGASSVEPYLFAGAIGACLIVPQRLVRVALLVTVGLVFTYYARDNPPIGVAVPVGAALFVTARTGALTLAAAAAVLVLLTSIGFRWHEGGDLGFLVGYEGVSNAALMAAVILLGDVVRGRGVAAEQAETIQALESERLRSEASIRLENERTAVARDLHDIVGHALSVISIQTAVATEKLPPQAPARPAVALARSTAVQSMSELRGLLERLRTEDESSDEGVASLADLDPLVDRVRRSGIAVALELDDAARPLPPTTDRTAYRVLQEALTNVTRHSHARHVRVDVRRSTDGVEIIVEDDGVGPTSTRTGHGLVGMAERVRLVGGTLTTGRGTDGGYRIRVVLPVEEAS